MHLRLLSAGSNAQGQLGQSHLEDSHTFQACSFASSGSSSIETGSQSELQAAKILSLCCGANHTFLLVEHEDGQSTRRELWGCGDGRKGQLGSSHHTRNSTIFSRIDEQILASAGLQAADYVIELIAACWESTFIYLRSRDGELRTSRGILLSMGSNDYGDLGIGSSPTELVYSAEPRRIPLEVLLEKQYSSKLNGFAMKRLVGGLHHAVAVVDVFLEDRTDSLVIGWGASRHGQLGDIPVFRTPAKGKQKQKAASKLPTCIPSPIIIRFPDGNHPNITDVSVGANHTIFLLSTGKLVGLGSNRKHQLDSVGQANAIIGVKCTWNGAFSIRNTSPSDEWLIYSSGSGGKGQLGRSHESASLTVDFPLTIKNRSLLGVACGSEHILTFLSQESMGDGQPQEEVWGWGWNEHGNLGLGHTDDEFINLWLWIPEINEHFHLLRIPRSLINTFSTRPLKWLRFAAYTVTGISEGDLFKCNKPAHASDIEKERILDYEDDEYDLTEGPIYYSKEGATVDFVHPNVFDGRTSSSRFLVSTSSISRVSNLLKEVQVRDGGYCVLTQRPFAWGCDPAHIIPRSKGNKLIQNITQRRCMTTGNEEEEPVDEIDDFRNIFLLRKDMYIMFWRKSLAFLVTPNFALTKDEIPHAETAGGSVKHIHSIIHASDFRYTLQWLVHDDTPEAVKKERRCMGLREEAPTGVDLLLNSEDDFPPRYLFDYSYGAALLANWCPQETKERIRISVNEEYDADGCYTDYTDRNFDDDEEGEGDAPFELDEEMSKKRREPELGSREGSPPTKKPKTGNEHSDGVELTDAALWSVYGTAWLGGSHSRRSNNSKVRKWLQEIETA
ncbi:hypothetical protein M422DRAFT_274190 [Sphaerobolus stellatus SS14]|uniref:HNH nuclease domain-containing protein n=1 Tax=Sphaerobolus stellatus (strain SS14) TaxID=990650 RepID=A0A0C9UHT6_SPHS4|nr:hypothetical protein M422DRAFT_274190 [Sphaerobolus stellatus SS14]